jgi:Domain of unknown function DUF29
MMHIMGHLYDQDLVLWSQEQAQALREEGQRGSNARIDWANVAEEIESLGKSDRRALASHIANIIEHLLKLQASPARDPEDGWIQTIQNGRDAIEQILADSPSLRPQVADIIRNLMPKLRTRTRESLQRWGERPLIDLDQLTYSEDQILGDWLPDSG